MILYHYSVDSWKGDHSLVNDYKRQYRFAEPYILALEKGRDVFDAVYLSTMYFSRELCELKLRKYENFRKDAVEGIFEYVRMQKYAEHSVSRLNCVYYCESEEEARSYVKEDCLDSGLFSKEQVALLEVQVKEERVFRYDQCWYAQAMEAIENNDTDTVFRCAEQYYACAYTEEPVIEVLCDSENTILRRIDL